MAKHYNETEVKINGEYVTIKSGDTVLYDGHRYQFDQCTYQFERWTDLDRNPPFGFQCNFEDGMNKAESLL